MRKIYVLAFILSLSLAVFAQQKRAVISPSLQNRAVLSPKYNGHAELPLNPTNPVVTSKSVNDDIIGDSRYDNQCNGSVSNRIFLWPDNSISAAWMRGTNDASGYGDRGTGYNYSTGTSWGAVPTARIETLRTGWPSLNPWMGNGEIVFAHNASATLVMNTRPAKGTGTWTQTLAPAGPTGVTSLLWPSVMTSGSTHQYVHILAIGQASYQGMSDALLYYRSLDGGATWDKNGVILPGMTIADGLGYSGDDYNWAAPKGDTIAFVVAGNWEDGYIMKSFDNGSTWTKTVFFNNPYKLAPMSQVVPTFWCPDGSCAITLDKYGKAHVAVGRMRANGDGAAHYYFPGTDGLIYWNETMPVMDTTRLSNLDTLDAHGQLAGYVATNQAGDSIVGFPKYGVGLSSFPKIVIDNYNNVNVYWSGITVGNPDPTPFNYRHIWVREWNQGFGTMVDMDADFLYIFQEFVYPSTASKLKNNQVQMICQSSSQPGSNIQDATVPVHDVSYVYRAIPMIVGVDQHAAQVRNQVGQSSPNPVKGSAHINISLERPAQVTLVVTDLLGQQVMTLNEGMLSSGARMVSFDCSSLKRGFYLLTVNINGEAFTQRIIKE